MGQCDRDWASAFEYNSMFPGMNYYQETYQKLIRYSNNNKNKSFNQIGKCWTILFLNLHWCGLSTRIYSKANNCCLPSILIFVMSGFVHFCRHHQLRSKLGVLNWNILESASVSSSKNSIKVFDSGQIWQNNYLIDKNKTEFGWKIMKS